MEKFNVTAKEVFEMRNTQQENALDILENVELDFSFDANLRDDQNAFEEG